MEALALYFPEGRGGGKPTLHPREAAAHHPQRLLCISAGEQQHWHSATAGPARPEPHIPLPTLVHQDRASVGCSSQQFIYLQA